MSSPGPPAKRQRLSASGAEAARTAMACNSCRERKIKCNGIHPCRYCSKRKLDCIFPDSVRKRMYSVEYVENLERRATLVSTEQRHDTENPEPTLRSPLSVIALENGPGQRHLGVESDTTEGEPSSKPSPIVPETSMSSSLYFGSKIRNLPTTATATASLPKTPAIRSPDNVYDLDTEGPSNHGRSKAVHWPTEEEAHNLLDTVLTSIGQLQHLIDPRSFSDKLSGVYDGATPRRVQNVIEDLWHVEILMVFALGELLQGKLKTNSSFPGAQYFIEAINGLPTLCALRNAGTLAIEIMGLFTFFLQCSDRKEDAYVYAGVGLRLAISNGLSRESSNTLLRRSEKTHRNRLWWTIYMQERRLAAATGNPCGISDESISTRLPTDSPGFLSVTALDLNIRLAKITGQIMQTVYGQKPTSERHFLASVQELLTSLAAVKRDMPCDYMIGVSDPASISRTGATLHLMLYQAMILTTRPILLHLAKLKLEGTNADVVPSEGSSLQKLASTCIEAAGRSLDVLECLKQRDILARFGFFDLDAAVSAAFIFVLVETIYAEQSVGSGVQGIKGVNKILQYLTKHGNKAAEKRLVDVEQMCEHLGIRIETVEAPARFAAQDDQPRLANELLTYEYRLAEQREAADTGNSELPHEITVGTDWRHALPQDSFYGLDNNYVGDLSFDEGSIDAFNLYFSADFMLTGADETDWEQFEKQTTRIQE